MKQILFLVLFMTSLVIHAQENLSAEVEKYVEYARGNYLLQNLIILDGTGTSAQEDIDIWIEGEIIKNVGKDLPVPPGATAIDLSGKSGIPGFVMLHEHMFYPKTQNGCC